MNEQIDFANLGREAFTDERITAMPLVELTTLLLHDAGDYATVASGATRDHKRIYSWDQRNVRAWEAARRLTGLAAGQPEQLDLTRLERELLDCADVVDRTRSTDGQGALLTIRLTDVLGIVEDLLGEAAGA